MTVRDQDSLDTVQSIHPQFKYRDIVWAKVRGHPWWPAMVGGLHKGSSRKSTEIKYVVYFIGDRTRSYLAERHLRDFKRAFVEHAFTPRMKAPNRKAITQACILLSSKEKDLQKDLLR